MQVKITHENSLPLLWFTSVSNTPVLNCRESHTFCKVCNLTFWLTYAVLALTHILNMEQSLRGTHRCGTSACVSTAPHRKSRAQAGFRPRKGDERKSPSERVVINGSDFRYRTESPAQMGKLPFPGGRAMPFHFHTSYVTLRPVTQHAFPGVVNPGTALRPRTQQGTRAPALVASLLAWAEQSVHPGVRTKVCEDVTYRQLNPHSF